MIIKLVDKKISQERFWPENAIIFSDYQYFGSVDGRDFYIKKDIENLQFIIVRVFGKEPHLNIKCYIPFYYIEGYDWQNNIKSKYPGSSNLFIKMIKPFVKLD